MIFKMHGSYVISDVPILLIDDVLIIRYGLDSQKASLEWQVGLIHSFLVNHSALTTQWNQPVLSILAIILDYISIIKPFKSCLNHIAAVLSAVGHP